MAETNIGALPKVLIVGECLYRMQQLAAEIRGTPTEHATSQSTVWDLETKYYSAKVHLDVRHLHDCKGLGFEGSGHEAVVMVFDMAAPSAFVNLQAWWQGVQIEDMGVKLAVGCSGIGAAAARRQLNEVQDWCAEQFVEYVELVGEVGGHLMEAAVIKGTAAAGDDGDVEGDGEFAVLSHSETAGVGRIIEALEAHMWPGMEIKRRQPSSAGYLHVTAAATSAAFPAATKSAPPVTADNASHMPATPADEAVGELSFSHYLQGNNGGDLGGSSLPMPLMAELEEGPDDMERVFTQMSGESEWGGGRVLWG
jgi:hypothetical protein